MFTTAGLAALAITHATADTTAPAAPPKKMASSIFIPPERCSDSQNAIGYYRRAYTDSRLKMRLTGAVARAWYPCDAARRRATEWRDKAEGARRALVVWTKDQWNWPAWLPDKWQRIGACETGYGRRPGNWQHNSGAYQGAFGFAVQSWDSFVPHADPRYGPYPSEAYEATPRQQYEVALAIYRRYGLSGWGCRGA